MPRLRSSKVQLNSMGMRGRWSISKVMSRFDSFGREVPAMYLNGDPEVNTWIGGLLTLAVLSVTLIYGAVKGVEFVKNTNPNVSDVSIPEYFGD